MINATPPKTDIGDNMTDMEHWEYQVSKVEVEGPGSFEERISQILRTCGNEGWELVAVLPVSNDAPHMIFKRPKTSPRKSK